jgi:hypothetical protein
MKPLYTEEDFNNAKSNVLFPLECGFCGNTFYEKKSKIKYEQKNNRGRLKFCSQICNNKKNNNQVRFQFTCQNCSKIIFKTKSAIKKVKNHFCSCSCAVSYNNKHKTKGNRRSKLEKWIEEQISFLYPNLDVEYNQKSAINSELDIYIKSLNLAFELNGIFHYEPIFGNNKLEKVKENDKSKLVACHKAKIDLCIIDTSSQIYFKPKTAQKYLDIIVNIIKERLLTS